MFAFLFTLALFFAWSAIGTAGLVLFGADLSDLRVALTAPILGTALTVIPLFVISNAGVAMEIGAPPVWLALLVAAVVVLALRRPRLPLTSVPVLLLSVIGLILLGRPMFTFGFDWIASANGDMAYYVLSATHLLEHGLQAAVDVGALEQNRGFSTSAQQLSVRGLRPGSQITLAGLAAGVRQPPLGLYMPMSLAMMMGTVCATGALALQASRRWWAASVAAALLVASPMAAYGIMQQLLPQNWGLGLAAALFAWLLRPELYRGRRPELTNLAVVGVLAAALFVVAYEVAASLALACVVYVGVLAVRRQVSLRALAFTWAAALAAIALVVNTFLPRALRYLANFVLPFGTSEGFGNVSMFGYAIVPTALPGAAGLRFLYDAPHTPHMSWFILAAALLLAGLFVVSVRVTVRGAGAGITVLTGFALALLLATNRNDFGLFKLYMYMQPFVAATLGVWLAGLTDRRAKAAGFALLVGIVAVQLPVLDEYVDRSRHPVDLRTASQSDLMPKFRELVQDADVPIVTVTDHFALLFLQGASAGERPLYFVGRNLFSLPWQKRAFDVPAANGPRRITFEENDDASRLLAGGSCVLSLPSGSQSVVNRRSLPEGSPSIVTPPCGHAENTLVFVVSSLGQPATLPDPRRHVSFWQLENDPIFPGRTFSGAGRYALFQILDPDAIVRLALDVTTTPLQARRRLQPLPSAAAVGADRVRLPLVGSGAARVFSPPLRPRLIGGMPYIVLDMGREGEFPDVPRPGITGLWGGSVPLDPRALTSYVRDVSLVSTAEYDALDAPRAIERFPEDLSDLGLEYSGLYEDGWVGRESYVHLAGGPAADLVLRADVLAGGGSQRLRVFVNGSRTDARKVAPGSLELRLRLPASEGRRKIELRWDVETPLAPPDRRSAAAHLRFLGFER